MIENSEISPPRKTAQGWGDGGAKSGHSPLNLET